MFKGKNFDIKQMDLGSLKDEPKQELQNVIEMRIAKVRGVVYKAMDSYDIYRNEFRIAATETEKDLEWTIRGHSVTQPTDLPLYSIGQGMKDAYSHMMKTDSEYSPGRKEGAKVISGIWEEVENDYVQLLVERVVAEIKRIVGKDLGQYGKFSVYANLIEDLIEKSSDKKVGVFATRLVEEIVEKEKTSSYHPALVKEAQSKYQALKKRD